MESIEPEPDVSADSILAIGNAVAKKRGRPPGSKNKPKEQSDDLPKVNQSNQKVIFAGALIALFSVLGIILGWFGYEYYERLTMEEAEEGGTYLIPISQRVEWLARGAYYFAFPVWMIGKMATKFRKEKVEPTPGRASQANGSQQSAANVNANAGGPPVGVNSPGDSIAGFKPMPLDNN